MSIDRVLNFITLMPPRDPDEKDVLLFRARVVFLILGAYVLIALMVLWSNGLIPGVSGFASDVAVQNLTDEVRWKVITDLERDIIEIQERQCQARVSQNTEALRSANEMLRDYAQKYEELAQKPVRIRSCRELGIPTP